MEAICHLDYVVLLCDDLPRMRAFYSGVMRFPLYRDLGDWVELRVGSTLLTLRRRGRPYDGPSFQPTTAGVQLAFRVTSAQVDTCHAELRRQDVAILEAPTTQPWGHRTLFFTDPEGNVLEIYADL